MQETASRRRLLRRLVARRVVPNQGALVELLGDAGYRVTQATVSRDLRALGAVKVRREDGRLRYVIPEDPVSTGESQSALARALEAFAEAITPTGSLVVLKTPPGAAHVVAAAIDAAVVDGVLGTVAGDDTVLVVADEKVGGWRVAKELERVGAGR